MCSVTISVDEFDTFDDVGIGNWPAEWLITKKKRPANDATRCTAAWVAAQQNGDGNGGTKRNVGPRRHESHGRRRVGPAGGHGGGRHFRLLLSSPIAIDDLLRESASISSVAANP